MKSSSLRLAGGLAFVITVCWLVIPPAPGLSVGSVTSRPNLQGVWHGERFDSGNGDGSVKGVKLALTFAGTTVKGLRLPQGDIGEGEFTLSADGAQIDAVGTTANFKGNTYLGVIKIQDDTLYWCTTAGGGKTQKRPTAFVADPAQRTYLIVVKRQKS